MRICILGNSVACESRPPLQRPEQLTYVEHLRDAGHNVRAVEATIELLLTTGAVPCRS
jgi:hypothetical protein